MVYKLTGPLGPVYIPTDGKIVLGRRTHPKVHKDPLCSRNQIEVVVEDDTVYATPIGVNTVKLTAKTNSESLDLKKEKRYVIHVGDTFTLYSEKYPFTLEKSKGGEEENSKRKHEDSEEEEKPKKKVKKNDENGNNKNKPVCKFGAGCYRQNPDHLEEFYHPPSSSSSPAKPKKKKTSDDEGGSEGESNGKGEKLKWRKYDSLLVLDSPDLAPATKIASFDMDDTLVKTSTGKVFAKGQDDWQWKFPVVPKKLMAAHKDGYRLVIFTNQAGIGTGKTKADDIKGKIIDLSKALGIPIVAVVATDKDKYRKPSPALWDFFVKHVNGGVHPSDAIFVGDAAGRSSGDGRPKKDHSASDRAFAVNVGIEFQTPEEYFLDEDPAPFRYDMFDPNTLVSAKVKSYNFEPADEQELIVFVGFPASGKSTFAKRKLVPKGYVHVNQDTMGTKEKCIKAAKAALSNGQSVVVDNTNPTAEVRAEYLAFAKLKKIPARCFHFETNMELAGHLNKFRALQTDGATKAVPGIAYNMYRSRFVAPTVDEGFDEVVKIKFVPEFDNKSDEKLFFKFM
eukprot:Phypoly_transcript_06003.p1 GENE.Phypoly_transcript_06003~~Phypoly_transcript_06003.p1  ORF type:complete len:564 (+),score=114.23 Phypoly_transcript_06003:157-1848(+)